MSIIESPQTIDLSTGELDNDSSFVNYESIPKVDLKTILAAQLEKNTFFKNNPRPIPSALELTDQGLYRLTETVDTNQTTTTSANRLLENAITRVRNSTHVN
jgi:hypothetical protein